MRKTVVLTAIFAASTAFAQQQATKGPNAPETIALQDCTRVGQNVECTFLFKTSAAYAMREYLSDYNVEIQTPNGQTFKPSQFQFSNGEWKDKFDINVKPGIQASGKMRIPNLLGDTISRLKFSNYSAFTNIKIQQPVAATRYPGLPAMRQQTRVSDTFYTAVLHGCYPTSSGKASCLVTLLADKPVAQHSGDTATYSSGVLMQVDNVPVTAGKARFTVGTATFKDVTVK